MRRGGSVKFVFVAGVILLGLLPQFQSASGLPNADPWRVGDVVTPKQLADSLNTTHKPVVVCVGFDFLFKVGHVPGAWYKGPASQSQGLENLKAWAKRFDHKKEIVIYCGCCPWKDCPNIRPAFAALKAMGFTHLKVMEIEKDFPTNWTTQGYPTEKGN
jgi:rhodanese-like protein